MIGWLMQLVQDANLSSCLGCCSKHSVAEIILGNHLRAAEGEEDSTLLDSLQALYIQAGISLQRIAQRSTVLGKGWRIEDNEIILLVVLIQILERILAECLVAWVAREVESDVLIGQLDRLGAAIHGVNRLGIAAHGIDRETAGIAEHVEHALALGVMLEQGAVLTLIYEETGLLTAQPIDMELQSVLHSHIISIATQDEAILLAQVCLVWQGGLALVVDVLQLVAHHLLQRLGNLHTAYMHTHTVSLHHGSRTIAVDNETRQVISLAMHQSIGVVVWISGDTYRQTHLVSRLQSGAPEFVVDIHIAEREHSHGDGTDLIVTDGDEVASRSENPYGFTFLYIIVHALDSAGEYPWMESLERFFFSFL